MSLTSEQQRAVKARGKVLVSASAGAGKTTVMIKRLADILENGASLDEVLAVTFTKKAAAQMKEKLRKELISRLDGGDDCRREHVRAQLNKINTADISTIHSFCARLIRTYFYALKVDASFEVLSDGAETNALRARAMDDLFDRLYEERDENLLILLEKLRKKRSDKYLKELLFSAYDEVRIHPDYLNILERACGEVYTETGFDTVCAELGEYAGEKCEALVRALDEFSCGFHPAAHIDGYYKVLDQMRYNLMDVVNKRDIFNPPARLATSIKPKACAETAEDDAAFSEFVDGVKKRYKSLFKDLLTREEERENFLRSGVLAKAFSAVLMGFDEVYDGVKREEGKLDYGDLEHFTLSLLKGGECDADVRERIRAKYKYVFVDEYQDVNPIQDEIITAVAGGDIFCVGDLKQAIYGFRGSSSRFFADKSESAEQGGEHVVLPDNFRSCPAVISFINRVFAQVMNQPQCEFDYLKGHAMRGGANYPKGCDGVAGICLFDGAEDEKTAAEGVYSVVNAKRDCAGFTAEGLAVLHLVEEALKGEYYDADEGRFKRVEAGDICVLTRKRANKNAQGIVRALTSKYPVAGAAEANICDRPEIIRLLNLLSFIDNGEQDVPLAAAMLSPAGNFTEAELAVIRLHGGADKNAPFRECVKKYRAEKDDGLKRKLDEFFARIGEFKELACSLGAAKLIDEIIVRSGDYAATFNSERKTAALRRLQQEACSPYGELYLGAFLAKIKASGYKILAQSALSSDCVKVMTMHASKGLEFPVVILADIAAGFKGDEKSEMPFDSRFGFAPRFYNDDTRVCRATVLRRLIRHRVESEELSNEINLFYVAATRAKYALYALTSRADGYDPVKGMFADDYADLFDVKAFNPRILPVQPQPKAADGEVKRVLDESRADCDTLEKLRENAEYKYKFELGVELPVKSSASHLLTLKSGEENAEQLFDEFEEDGAETNIEAGVAYHRYLELCDFSVRDQDGIRAQIEKFAAAGLMDKSHAALLDAAQLEKILSMPAFAALTGKNLYREREFICRLPSRDFLALKEGGESFSVGEDDGNGVIVQGAIDLLVIKRENGKAVAADIVDYKFSRRTERAIKQKYAPQLALYKCVVRKIYALSEEAVTTTVINLNSCKQIDMDE